MRHLSEVFTARPYGYSIRLTLTDDIVAYCRETVGQELVPCPVANVFDFRSREDYPVDFEAVFRTDRMTEDSLVHETFHITARIMRYIGTPLIEETEEPYAYLQDDMFKMMKNRLLRMKPILIELINGNTGQETPEATTGSRQVEEGQRTQSQPQ